MKIKLPRWIKGQRPKAAELNQLAEAIERLANLAIDGGTGLQIEETGAGWKLSYIPRPLLGSAVVTGSTIPAYNATTRTYGKGTATLDLANYSTAGVLTTSTRTPTRTIDIYNGGNEPIPAGRRVEAYEERPGRWRVLVNYCPVTP